MLFVHCVWLETCTILLFGSDVGQTLLNPVSDFYIFHVFAPCKILVMLILQYTWLAQCNILSLLFLPVPCTLCKNPSADRTFYVVRTLQNASDAVLHCIWPILLFLAESYCLLSQDCCGSNLAEYFICCLYNK